MLKNILAVFERLDEPPSDIENVSVSYLIAVGPETTQFLEYYTLTVMSPRWVSEQMLTERYFFINNSLIVPRFDEDVIEQAVRDLLCEIPYRDLSDVSYEEASSRLAHFMLRHEDKNVFGDDLYKNIYSSWTPLSKKTQRMTNRPESMP